MITINLPISQYVPLLAFSAEIILVLFLFAMFLVFGYIAYEDKDSRGVCLFVAIIALIGAIVYSNTFWNFLVVNFT
jgi:hypothetical protein